MLKVRLGDSILLRWHLLLIKIMTEMVVSQSVTVKDDRLWLMYTGHIEETGVRQVQKSGVFSDDGIYLKRLNKTSCNPDQTCQMSYCC